ncbi:MAG TPA: LPS export ABC transporter periplasmic protein LptC [Candidatus Baltobacteraceae bacterium]|nr:LPS export ABC transporter periplasmic protein LptC [Candidatus Baltobacteraceae bacterium]
MKAQAKLFAAAIALASSVLSACGEPQGGAASSSPATNSPATSSPAPTLTPLAVVIHSQGNGRSPVTLVLQREGHRIYAIRADSNTTRRTGAGSGVSDFLNPHVTFFEGEGKTLVADSPKATILESDRTIVMSDGVRTRSSDGIVLTSRTLTYDDRTQRLRAEGNVVVTTASGERLEGERADADLRMDQLRVTGVKR